MLFSYSSVSQAPPPPSMEKPLKVIACPEWPTATKKFTALKKLIARSKIQLLINYCQGNVFAKNWCVCVCVSE
jgi:hypothetical protein